MATANLIPYLTEEKIQQLNRAIGKKISEDYSTLLKTGEELLVVVTLKGALFFAADLLREITVPVRVDFVRLSSYGGGTKSSGTVRFLKDLEVPPGDQHVLIVDEIVDSGRTLNFLKDRISAANPRTVKICSLLSKPSRREIAVEIDYLGTEVEDRFVVGYGLDFDERYRNLKQIFELKS